ncbi:MAG: Crp/Fnr family transcriptional regulator [Acidobacteriota bacterium]|nr:Crp/Fnr family transcriptional regulator [Acidobacteriota bacterium]
MNATALSSDTARGKSKEEFLNLFRQRGELKDHPPKTELFRQGQPIRNICLIERGLVKFTCAGKQGREMVVALRAAGSLLGAAATVSNCLPWMTASTLTECQIYCLSAEAFLRLVENDFDFSLSILRAISRQLYEQTNWLALLGTASARARQAHLLLQLVPESAYQQQGEIRLNLPMSKADLARMLAITPQHFSSKLRELEEMNILRRGKGWIYVRDLTALIHEAE